jgi:hypothetical protein
MVIIRFHQVEMRRQALGCLLGRFPGKSWVGGELMVPEAALPYLAAEGVQFYVDGPATYSRILSLNESAGVPTTEAATADSV